MNEEPNRVLKSFNQQVMYTEQVVKTTTYQVQQTLIE